MANTYRAVIRCDASPAIGMGHIVRCCCLAQELKSLNIEPLFVVNPSDAARSYIRKFDFRWVEFSRDDDDYLEFFQNIVEEENIDVFIGDVRDGLPISLINFLKSLQIVTLGLDEPSDYRVACDKIFYPPSPFVQQLDWTGFTGEIAQGWDYIVLRPDFYKPYEVSAKKDWLLMLGGTDAKRLTLPILKQLVTLPDIAECNLHVVCRETHPDFQTINSYAKSPNVLVHTHVENMAALMASMSLAIISFGVSAYELAALNVPAYHVCIEPDHHISHIPFAESGLARKALLEDIGHIVPFKIDIPLSVSNGAKKIASEILASLESKSIKAMA
ncbi:hypothetical protein ACFSJY_17930 [Thalassotalea euphylliae]|uniref:hypothetical protein n=1 Tax=Thalassotalea euphylliae TaxID=1655234 RepID=UPI00363BA084